MVYVTSDTPQIRKQSQLEGFSHRDVTTHTCSYMSAARWRMDFLKLKSFFDFSTIRRRASWSGITSIKDKNTLRAEECDLAVLTLKRQVSI